MKKLLLLLVLIGLGLAGVAYWLRARQAREVEADTYTLVPVEYGRVSDVVSATGVIQPRQVFPVGTEASGKVVAVLADFNQVVEEGEVLARLDDRLARDRLSQAEQAVRLAQVGVKQAQTNRDTARRALERERSRSPEVRRQADLDLLESQLRGAEVGIEAARVKVEEAEEGRRQADLALSLTVVRAPVLAPAGAAGLSADRLDSGGVGALASTESPPRHRQTFTVLDRKVVLNQVVGPPLSTQLFTLAADLSRMQVLAQVAEGDVQRVHRGLKAEFTVSGSGEGEPTFRGVVEEVRLMPANDRGAVYYQAVVDVRNQRDPATREWLLRPGLTASVDLLLRVHEGVWKLPSAALNFQPDDAVLSKAARAKLASWQNRPGHEQWRPVWVPGPGNRPWPIFVRLGGTNAQGEPGLQDTQFTEVLEWDPDLRPQPDPRDPSTFPQVVIGMTTPKKAGLFSPPNIKF